MGSNQLSLFEDLLFMEDAATVVRNIEEAQGLIVRNCVDFAYMIPEIYHTLQNLKEFFREMEKLKNKSQ